MFKPPVNTPVPIPWFRNSTVPPELGKVTESLEYEYEVTKAIKPAIANAMGVPPWERVTERPKTAKIPPPIMPPIPMENADQNPIVFLFSIPVMDF